MGIYHSASSKSLWIGQSCCTEKLSATEVTCTRSIQLNIPAQREVESPDVPSLTRELLATDGCLGREGHFFLVYSHR